MSIMEKILRSYYKKLNDVEKVIEETKGLYQRGAHEMLTDEDIELLNEVGEDVGFFKMSAKGATVLGFEPLLETTARGINFKDEPVVETPDEPVKPKFNPFKVSKENVSALEAKVTSVIAGFEAETNPALIQLAALRIQMLRAKIENQIKLVNIKEQYKSRRTDIALTRNSDNVKQVGEISKLELEIANLTAQIEAEKKSINPKYDPDSSKFIVKPLMSRLGGLEETLKFLDASEEGQVTAQMIRDTIEAKRKSVNSELERKLEEAKAKLRAAEGQIRNEGLTNFKNVASAKRKETSLALTQQGRSIFSRIANFGKSLVSRWKDHQEERSALKDIDKERDEAIAEADRKLAEAIAELKRKHAEAREDIKTSYDKDKKRAAKDIRTEKAKNFRDEIYALVNPTAVQVREDGDTAEPVQHEPEGAGLEPGEDD